MRPLTEHGRSPFQRPSARPRSLPTRRHTSHLDELAESAQLLGAVSCVVRREGRWIEKNTDGQGLVAALQLVRAIPGQRVLPLGAGGAARAIAVERALAGAVEIWIADRTTEKAEEVATLGASSTQARCSVVARNTPVQVP